MNYRDSDRERDTHTHTQTETNRGVTYIDTE